jgi:hypothetical protein
LASSLASNPLETANPKKEKSRRRKFKKKKEEGKKLVFFVFPAHSFSRHGFVVAKIPGAFCLLDLSFFLRALAFRFRVKQ